MKAKRVSHKQLQIAWLVLALSLGLLSVAMFFSNDPRLHYALGMTMGVQLWKLIQGLYEEFFVKEQESKSVIQDAISRLSDDEYEKAELFLAQLVEKREKKQ